MVYHTQWYSTKHAYVVGNYYRIDGRFSFELEINRLKVASGGPFATIGEASDALLAARNEKLKDPRLRFSGAQLIVMFDRSERRWSVIAGTDAGFTDTHMRFDTESLARQAIA